MCVIVCVSSSVNTYVSVSANVRQDVSKGKLSVWQRVSQSVCQFMNVRASAHVCTCACMCACVCVHACMCVCVFVYVRVYMPSVSAYENVYKLD